MGLEASGGIVHVPPRVETPRPALLRKRAAPERKQACCGLPSVLVGYWTLSF